MKHSMTVAYCGVRPAAFFEAHPELVGGAALLATLDVPIDYHEHLPPREPVNVTRTANRHRVYSKHEKNLIIRRADRKRQKKGHRQ